MRPRLQDGWFAPKAPHDSPGQGAENRALLEQLRELDLIDDDDHPQHKYAVTFLSEVFERFLVPLSYLDEQDALGLCVANCNLKTLLDHSDQQRCLVYFMDHGRARRRTLTNGRIPQLFQGRSSAGEEAYPGDRAFCDRDRRIPTIQVHMLTLSENGEEVPGHVPAVAVKVPNPEDVLIHED
ncbi:MAG: hypothetical protein AAF497_10755 [Planctomycetota bacterium]